MCPTAVPPEHPDSYYSVADRLARGDPRRVPARPVLATRPTRRRTSARTGPEIWRQTAGRITHFVAGRRHRRHDHRRRPLPQGAEPGGADRRRRPRGLGVLGRHRPARTWSRASARTSGPTTYDPSVVDRVVMVSDARLVPHRPAGHPRGGPPHRRFGRHRGARRARGRRGARARRTSSSCCSPTPAAATCRRSSTTSGWPTTASCAPSGQTVGDVLAAQGRPTCRRSCTCTPTRRCATSIAMHARVRRVAGAGRHRPSCRSAAAGGGRRASHERDADGPGVPRPGGARPAGRRGHGRRRCRCSASASRSTSSSSALERGAGGARARRRPPGRRAHPLRRARRSSPAGCRVSDLSATPATAAASRPAAIHAGQAPDPSTGAVVPPIHLATTFAQDGGRASTSGYEYARTRQPHPAPRSRRAWRRSRARRTASRFASGMAAEDAVLRAARPRRPRRASRPTPTAARSGWSPRVHGPAGLELRRRRPHRPRRAGRGLAADRRSWCGSRRRPTRC